MTMGEFDYDPTEIHFTILKFDINPKNMKIKDICFCGKINIYLQITLKRYEILKLIVNLVNFSKFSFFSFKYQSLISKFQSFIILFARKLSHTFKNLLKGFFELSSIDHDVDENDC